MNSLPLDALTLNSPVVDARDCRDRLNGGPGLFLNSLSEDSLKQFPIAVGNVPEGVQKFVVFHVPTIGRGATKCLSAVRGIYQEHTTENLRA